jgi:hypothetical protein
MSMAKVNSKDAPRKHAVRRCKVMDHKMGAFELAEDSSLFRVLGALREEDKPAPTDEEVEQMIADYLLEKHA